MFGGAGILPTSEGTSCGEFTPQSPPFLKGVRGDPSLLKRVRGREDEAVQCPYGSNSRTSLTLPFTAAATTIAGLISKVRPSDDPCRPLKLRLDEEALI